MASPFEALADFLPEPMALVSPDGVLRAVNGAFAAAGHGGKEAAIGRTLSDLGWLHADGWAEYLRQCARTRSFVIGAAQRRGDDGEVAYRCEGALYEPRTAGADAVVLLRFLPKSSSSSRFVAQTQRIGELSAEIARRQRAETQARDERELLHVTLSSIGDAVIATDRSGRVTFMNRVAERLTGWPQAEAAGVPVRDIFRIVNEDTREAVADPVEKVIALGEIVGLANHTLLIARDGSERPIDDSGAPIVDGWGRLHGVVLVFRDVTELRAAEREQTAARQAAEAANRAKDEFLATLSHELRTPLNAIIGWTRIMLRGVLDETRRTHALSVIERNADMQARLIEDLLDVSRIMLGQLRLQHTVIDLARVVEAALDSVRPAADNKLLRVTSSVRVASAVHGDPARLQQVIWNLLTNAVKFTPPGGTISVDATEAEGAVRIAVRDSGQGFPAAFHPRLFEAFSQADASFGRPHGGLGLGLTIVRRLVEAHGGTVEAQSGGADRGATFTVTLPVGRDTLPAAPADAPAEAGDLLGCRVLVIDDNADASELTRTVLEAAGAAVVTRATAREALAAMAGDRFEVLVADIGLPGEDGLWLIDQIRRLPDAEHRRLPAVALTAFAGDGDRRMALAAGYDEHVPKPPDFDDLLRVVGRLRAKGARAGRGTRP